GPTRGPVASCAAILRTDVTSAATSISGYHPAGLRSAYGLTTASSNLGTGQTVAVVDAFDDPNAESDLAVYRSQFGAPPCTPQNGCFRKVNERGGTSYPVESRAWSQEISVDLDMVSAVCPNCRILLVEANSASLTDLGTAVDEAAVLHATEISNSYGGGDAADSTYGAYYKHPGIAITASAGDAGYGVSYPASSRWVTAVGGTTLNRASNARGWVERAWRGTGSGCSTLNLQPSWQAAAGTGCARRAVADVAADADPATGVAVYDSVAYNGASGWLVFGGTSVAAPIIASVYALAGNAATVQYGSFPYSHATALWDVTSGTNSTSGCTPFQLCTAQPGWDGPTGLGTPNGTGGF
ncbi:MAG TPA: S8 family serine peptidase, partial [Acidimicrobiales bacterium]|nr:S8 family serine peptidase [Acidimicrobiales bacterium]